MPIQTLNAEAFEALDETERANYVPFDHPDSTDDAPLYVTPEDNESFSTLAGNLKGALNKERDTRRELERVNKSLEESSGTDAATLQAEREALDLERQTFAKERQAHTLETALTNAVLTHKGNSEILLPYLREKVGFSDDGKMQVLGKDGQPLMSEAGDMVTPEQYVAALAADKKMADFFASPQRAGGGSDSHSMRGAGSTTHSRNPHAGKQGQQPGETRRQYIDRARDEGRLPPARTG